MSQAEEFDRSFTPILLDVVEAGVRPSPEFSHILEKFYSSDAIHRLGGKALELVNTNVLSVYNRPDTEFYTRRSRISLQELREIEAALASRVKNVPVEPTAYASKLLPLEDRQTEKPGLDLGFTIAIDQLTARALAGTVLLEHDDTFQVHFRINGEDLTTGSELLNARDTLVAALRAPTPQFVESAHIITHNLRP
jgi:hypothetical protein